MSNNMLKNTIRKITRKNKPLSTNKEFGKYQLKVAENCYKNNNLFSALSIFEDNIEFSDDKENVYAMCASICRRTAQYDKAINYYEKIINDYGPNIKHILSMYEISKITNNDQLSKQCINKLKNDYNYCEKESDPSYDSEKIYGILTEEEYFDKIIKDGRVDRSLFKFPEENLYSNHSPDFVCRRNGNHQITKWGDGLTVRGIDCLRGYIISDLEYTSLQIFVSGVLVYDEKPIKFEVKFEKTNKLFYKYVYNAWIDFGRFPMGRNEVIISAVNANGYNEENITWKRENIIVADQIPEGFFDQSDGIIRNEIHSLNKGIDDEINSLPSFINRASTSSFPGKLSHIAVIRADQLGDMVVSIPALIKLRELLPSSKITGVLSPANAELARTLNIFDDYIILDFPDDPVRRQRIMNSEKQQELILKFSSHNFDLAIDLSIDGMSKKLLPLTGAPVTMGLGRGDCKTLDVEIVTHDPKTGNDFMRHSARTRLLIEALARWINSGACVVKNENASKDFLKDYGINKDEKYIVLHTGSRIKFTQWPFYTHLANKIALETDLKCFFIADNELQIAELSKSSIENGKIIYVDKLLPSDHFDSLLSNCSIFVGNDSGPKHLASLRGAKVISLHSARIGWPEWGQEHGGVVISRKVPCAGCYLHHNPEECGKDVACIKKITLQEVFGEILNLI